MLLDYRPQIVRQRHRRYKQQDAGAEDIPSAAVVNSMDKCKSDPIKKERQQNIFNDCTNNAGHDFPLLLERFARNTRLTDNGLQCADTDFAMVRYGNRYRSLRQFLLHDNVAAASTNLQEAMSGQDRANLFAVKDAKPTQTPPRSV